MPSDDASDGVSDVNMEPQFLELDKVVIPTLEKLGTHRSEYRAFPEEGRVERCIREVTKDEGLWYLTAFAGGHTDLVSTYMYCGVKWGLRIC